MRAYKVRGNALSLVPGHDVGDPYFVESSEEGKCGKQDGSDDELQLVEGLEQR